MISIIIILDKNLLLLTTTVSGEKSSESVSQSVVIKIKAVFSYALSTGHFYKGIEDLCELT